MNIVCIGGGPASLYFAMLAKKRHPDWSVVIHERNPADVTWGFGVVFSDDTMDGFRDDDEQTCQAITDSFVHWDDIDIFFKGEKITSTGHGFAGMQRLKLLQILEARAREVGVEIHHDSDVTALDDHKGADLIIAGDGIGSFIRAQHEADFGTDVVMRPNKFVWMGTTKPFDAFTFYFNETEHGLFRAHCYQYMPGTSTFIVECTEETWRRAGLDQASEADTLAFCESVFAKELDGEALISNMSIWRTFPRVRNARYFHDNIVLLGDALHTAHFSIGSGTKLAMEDGVALAKALDDHASLSDALAAFQAEREPAVDSLQRAAQVSMEWFEETERYYDAQEPIQFAYSLLTRSMRINHDNLALRDPALVARAERWVAEQAEVQSGRKANVPGRTPPPIFTPFRLRDLVLENRIVLSPMCMYSAVDGVVNDWHLVHLGSRAVGGAGLIYAEMTAISPQARITPGCAGIWNDDQVAAWGRVNAFIHANSGAKTCLQLGHAGRKASTKVLWEGMDRPLDDGNWEVIAPSAIPYAEGCHVPREMTRADMDATLADYMAAARNALAAGFDMIELHMAHGYLLSTFLSPLTNARTDDYGGSIENRMRYPMEVFTALRAAWPETMPMAVRISATDWKEGGFSDDDAAALTVALRDAGCDIVDVSAGQVVKDQKPVYGRLFQTPFSTKLRLDTGMATMTVGNIQSFGDANAIIAGGRADLCVIARMHLADPYWTRHAAYEYDWPAPWPNQYVAVQRYTPRWS
ncbi:MAG: bifunctional salicylyl-CoA 5-hydroxylase/oxidoreductase [Rhodobacterales bacterium]|nr:bifunctional salicylyl-CoA 5-hydroxylase/oxidoreductase [Rhodobacterales bacterium]